MKSRIQSSFVPVVLFVIVAGIAALPWQAEAQRYGLYHGFRQTYPGAIAVGLQIGGNGNYALNGPKGECNCEFDNGAQLGYHAGLHLDIVVNRWFGLRLQALYEDLSTVYTRDQQGQIFLDDGSLAAITAQRRVEVDLQYTTLSFSALWLTGASGLYFLTGAGAGFYLDGHILEEEFISDPPGLLYPETGSSRIVYRDEALDASEETEIRALLMLGAGYDIPLGRGAALAPELQFDLPITSVVSGNADWRIATLRASFVLRFGL